MRKQIVFVLIVLLLASVACMTEGVASNSAQLPVMPTSTMTLPVVETIPQTSKHFEAETITVTDGYWNIRSQHNGHGSVLAIAQSGDVLTIVSHGDSGFVYVQDANGITGYISEACCE